MKIIKRKTNLFFTISLILSGIFLISPLWLKCNTCLGFIDRTMDVFKYVEYKEAYISAVGGMLGSFLAITGALWVEKELSKVENKKIIRNNAFILYHDIKLFYEEVSPLAMPLAAILGISIEIEKERKFLLYKNSVGIHIHSNWIELVAGLSGSLTSEQIKDIYSFYGNVEDVKRIIDKEKPGLGEIGNVNRIVNLLGNKNTYYVPNEKYKNILLRLKEIAEIQEESQ